jgi:hypothetical protein
MPMLRRPYGRYRDLRNANASLRNAGIDGATRVQAL